MESTRSGTAGSGGTVAAAAPRPAAAPVVAPAVPAANRAPPPPKVPLTPAERSVLAELAENPMRNVAEETEYRRLRAADEAAPGAAVADPKARLAFLRGKKPRVDPGALTEGEEYELRALLADEAAEKRLAELRGKATRTVAEEVEMRDLAARRT